MSIELQGVTCALEVCGLRKAYASGGVPVRALRGVDLSVAQGESPEPSTKPSETNGGILPVEIVGVWETAGGDATLAYRFLSDGRYQFAALLTQPVPESRRGYSS